MGTHPPLSESLSLHEALVLERHASAQPHAPISATFTHDLTLAIDESGTPAPASSALRGSAAAWAPGAEDDDLGALSGGIAYVNSSKGEPNRHDEDAHRRR